VSLQARTISHRSSTSSVAHVAPHSCPTRRSPDLSPPPRPYRPRPLRRRRVRPRPPPRPSHRRRTPPRPRRNRDGRGPGRPRRDRSEEHTSELQSRENLVCRLLLEKKNLKTSVAIE